MFGGKNLKSMHHGPSESIDLARNGQLLGFPQHQAHQPLNYFAILTCSGLPIVPLKIVIKSSSGLAIPSLDPTQKMIHGLLHVMLPCRKLSEVVGSGAFHCSHCGFWFPL
jgi:hypothetical protein